jgi:Flp pilus assembly protein TadD
MDDAVYQHRRIADQFPTSAEAQYNLGNALYAAGSLNEAIACYRRAIELKPQFAEAQSNLGVAYERQGRWADAINCFRRAIELLPTNAEAHSNLGNALKRQGKFDDAIAAYRQALELRPDFAIAQHNLSVALHAAGRFDEAEAGYRRAAELDPRNADAWTNMANIQQEHGRYEEAAACYERALHHDHSHALAHWNQSHLLLRWGDFERGWKEYEWRWKTGQIPHRHFQTTRWTGESLEGRTVLLHAEQGFGDTFQFIRYAPLVKERGGVVVVECQKGLVNVLRQCPLIDRLVAAGDEPPLFDVQAPLISLPGIFGTTIETIPANVPYVFAEPGLIELWRQTLRQLNGFRIGINWAGRSEPGLHKRRDIPLEHFAALGEAPEVRLISLQKGGDNPSLALRACVMDFGEELDTAHGAFMDTAAIMINLDLVITSDTSVAHLAGALGVPVWVALPFVPEWRWMLDRSDSPWYPTMRLFRQKSPGDWAGVFKEIEAALRERLAR